MALLLLSVIASIKLILYDISPEKIAPWDFNLALFFILFYSPVQLNVWCGQLGGLVAFILILCWRLGRSGFLKSTAVILGFLAAIKLFVGFFVLFFLLKKEYKLSSIFLASFVLFSCAPLFFGYDVSLYLGYIRTILFSNWIYLTAHSNWNVSLYSFFARIIYFFSLNKTSALFLVVKMIYYILFSFVFYWYIDRVRQLRMDRDFDFIFILTAMVMFVLCPLSWTYYMVFLILVVFVLYQRISSFSLSCSYWPIIAICLFFIGVGYSFMPNYQVADMRSLVLGSLPMLGFLSLSWVSFRISYLENNAAAVDRYRKISKIDIYSGLSIALIPGIYDLIKILFELPRYINHL